MRTCIPVLGFFHEKRRLVIVLQPRWLRVRKVCHGFRDDVVSNCIALFLVLNVAGARQNVIKESAPPSNGKLSKQRRLASYQWALSSCHCCRSRCCLASSRFLVFRLATMVAFDLIWLKSKAFRMPKCLGRGNWATGLGRIVVAAGATTIFLPHDGEICLSFHLKLR